MANALISFLGTSDYVPCRYEIDGKQGSVVKYVQEDLAVRFGSSWGDQDEIRIYVTAEADRKNWQDNGHKDHKTGETIQNAGLGQRLSGLGLKPGILKKKIPNGESGDEIWEIFQILYDSMKDGDEIVFDITHSFRSIPMLFMVLISYARLLKNISVSSICYGAFEILGHPSVVKKDIPEEERIAPIFDLTPFVKLIDWSQAIQSFVRNGSAEEFTDIVKREITPILKDTRGKDDVASDLRSVADGIRRISGNLLLNRGAEIVQYNYDGLRNTLAGLREKDIFIKPVTPLFEVIEKKIDGFAQNDIDNGFRAVNWCLEHGLYQQAVTMLQETIVTWVLARKQKDWGAHANRDAASAAFRFLVLPKPRKEWKTSSEDQADLIAHLMEDPVMAELAKAFDGFRQVRNDLNHGGYLTEVSTRARTGHSILQSLESFYHECVRLISRADGVPSDWHRQETPGGISRG